MSTKQFVSFTVQGEVLGLDILYVREINRTLTVTSVHRAPGHVAGLLNLRGQIVTVLDLAMRLGMKKTEDTGRSCCVVLKTSSEVSRARIHNVDSEVLSPDVIGLLVDDIGDVIEVNEDEIESASMHKSGVASRFVDGVIKLDKQLMLTLNIGEVLSLEAEKQAIAGV